MKTHTVWTTRLLDFYLHYYDSNDQRISWKLLPKCWTNVSEIQRCAKINKWENIATFSWCCTKYNSVTTTPHTGITNKIQWKLNYTDYRRAYHSSSCFFSFHHWYVPPIRFICKYQQVWTWIFISVQNKHIVHPFPVVGWASGTAVDVWNGSCWLGYQLMDMMSASGWNRIDF